jgi:hypothetical protein
MIEVAESRPIWARGWFWILLAVCSIVPFLASPLPMMPDYFSHMARYHVESHIAGSAYLSRYYAFNWHLIGNLGVDLVMVPLSRLLPTELAARIAAGMIPPLTILGIYAAAKAAWGRIEAPALLALPFAWSFSFIYGFVNYHLAFALALLVFALWIRCRSLPFAAHVLVFAPLGMVVWVAHVAGWGALLVMVGGWQLATAWERNRRVAATVRDTALRVLPLLLPVVFIVAWRQAGAGTSDLFAYDFPSKLIWPFTVLKAEHKAFDIACVGVIGLAVAWLALSRSTRKHAPLLTSAAALALAYCVMPQMLFDSAFADTRLLPVLAIVLVLALAPAQPRQAQWVAGVALALFAARLTAITVGWHERGAAAEADLAALDQVPRGSRIAAFAPPTYCLTWQMRGFEHLPSIAIIRREAFVNTQWDTPGAQLMRPIYNEAHGFNDAASVSVRGGRCGGKTMNDMLRMLPRDRFDYVWIFQAPVPETPWLRQVFSGPDGRLYAILR